VEERVGEGPHRAFRRAAVGVAESRVVAVGPARRAVPERGPRSRLQTVRTDHLAFEDTLDALFVADDGLTRPVRRAAARRSSRVIG
jgi:hypothetical protein